jgi:endogenous inhibitor of DNA gyrase (YacG/DUF329 family)
VVGRREAKIAGNRRYPSWCSKKCQEAELDNTVMIEYGIDMEENREAIRHLKKMIKSQ